MMTGGRGKFGPKRFRASSTCNLSIFFCYFCLWASSQNIRIHFFYHHRLHQFNTPTKVLCSRLLDFCVPPCPWDRALRLHLWNQRTKSQSWLYAQVFRIFYGYSCLQLQCWLIDSHLQLCYLLTKDYGHLLK